MKKRSFALILCVSLIFVMTACSSGSSGGSADTDLSPSEQTMANFVSKLEAGNYVVDIPGKVRTTVYSPEQGYINVDPRTVGSNKTFAYNNEELQKFITFDLLSEENGAAVSFNFISRGPLAGSILAEKAGF